MEPHVDLVGKNRSILSSESQMGHGQESCPVPVPFSLRGPQLAPSFRTSPHKNKSSVDEEDKLNYRESWGRTAGMDTPSAADMEGCPSSCSPVTKSVFSPLILSLHALLLVQNAH